MLALSRLFDAVDDESRHSIGSSDFGFGTMIAVVRRAGTSWASIMGNHTAGGLGRVGMLFNAGDQLCWFDELALKYTTAITGTPAMGWIMCAVTKTTGTTSPRIHLYRWDTNTWQHADNTIGTCSNRGSQAGGNIRIGQIENSDFFNGRKAVLAQRANVAPLSDAEIEGLRTNFTRAYWDSLGMTFLVDELDAFATDYGGTSTQTLLVGTADDADDPPGWASWAGGGAPAAPSSATVRFATAVGGRKSAQAPAAVTVRFVAQAQGGAIRGTGGQALLHLGTTAAGRKTGLAAASASARSSTAASGRKTAIGAHEEASAVPPFTVLVVGAVDRVRFTTAATGSAVAQVGGPGAATVRFSTAVVGRKSGAAVVTAAVRFTTSAVGQKTGRVTAAAIARFLAVATGRKAAAAASSSQVRFATAAAGAAVIPQAGPAAALVRFGTVAAGRKAASGAAGAQVRFAAAATGAAVVPRQSPAGAVVRFGAVAVGRKAASGSAGATVKAGTAAAGRKAAAGPGAASTRFATQAAGTGATAKSGPSSALLRFAASCEGRAARAASGAAGVRISTSAAGRKTARAAGAARVSHTTLAAGRKSCSGAALTTVRFVATLGPTEPVTLPVIRGGRALRPGVGGALGRHSRGNAVRGWRPPP